MPFTKFFTNHVGKFCLLVGLMCFAGITQAQTRITPCNAATPTNALCLSITTAPTTRTDGSPITGALTYRWEQRTTPSGTFASIGTQTTLQKYVTNLAAGSYEFRAFAVESGNGESASSNVASGSSTISPPSAPVIIIAATISANGPPVFRIIQSVNLKPNEVVMVAPASMRPLFANR